MSIYIGDKEIKDLCIGDSSAKEVYVGTTKVRPGGWTPGANTVAYLKLEADTNDSSGSGNNGTPTNITYTTISTGKSVAMFNGSARIDFSTPLVSSGDFTFSIRIYGNNNASLNNIWGNSENGDARYTYGLMSDHYDTYLRTRLRNTGVEDISQYSNGTWFLYTITRISGVVKAYKNANQIASKTASTYSPNVNFCIGSQSWDRSRDRIGYMSDFICKSVGWTAQEVTDYYNLTKGNYGL